MLGTGTALSFQAHLFHVFHVSIEDESEYDSIISEPGYGTTLLYDLRSIDCMFERAVYLIRYSNTNFEYLSRLLSFPCGSK